PIGRLLAMLADPEESPIVLQERLRSTLWEAYNAGARKLLRAALLDHPDQFVRDEAARVMSLWNDAAGRLQLLGDPAFSVRETGRSRLGQLPPSPAVAPIAWSHLQRSDAWGFHASESLAGFVRHAPPGEAIPRLAEIAANPEQDEGLRCSALYDLRE